MSDDKDNIGEALDDAQIRDWFQSRDPDRKKADPFISEDSQKEYTGKSSALTRVEKPEDEKMWGVSYSEHLNHLSETSRNYSWIGVSIGIAFAIMVTIAVNLTT